MAQNTVDLLPTALMNNPHSMIMTCHLTRVLDSFHVSTVYTQCVHNQVILELTELLHNYHLNKQIISKLNSHCDSGVIISDNLSQVNHYAYNYTYKTLSLIRCTFKSSYSLSIKTSCTQLTLLRSMLTYCSPVWWPCLLNDINSLEIIKCHTIMQVQS